MRITRKDLDLLAEAYDDMSGPRSMERTTPEDAETPVKVTGPPRKKFRFRKYKKSLQPDDQKMTVKSSVKPPRKKLNFFSQSDK